MASGRLLLALALLVGFTSHAGAQPRRLLEIEVGVGVALPSGGRQFEFPGGFVRFAPVLEAGARWNLWQNGSLAAVIQHVQFGYTESGTLEGIARSGSRRMLTFALETQHDFGAVSASVRPTLGLRLGYSSQRFEHGEVCSNDAQTQYWACSWTSGDAGFAGALLFGIAVHVGTRWELVPTVSATSAWFGGGLAPMGNPLDEANWLGLSLRISATVW